MRIEKVSAYKTLDGKLFGSEEEAISHNEALTERKAVDDIYKILRSHLAVDSDTLKHIAEIVYFNFNLIKKAIEDE